MTIGSILLGLALLVLVGLFISRPLFMTNSGRRQRPVTKRQALVAQKEAIVVEISNLDFDYDTGKIPEEDYRPRREHLIAEAATLLKEIDLLDQQFDDQLAEQLSARATPVSGSAADINLDIEAAIASRRAGTKEPAPVKLASEPVGTRNGKTNYCTQCGHPVEKGDKFCAGCGQNLLEPQRA